MNTKRTRMTKEDRRKQILESAISVFVQKGYNGTTTLEIAKSANISEVTLFRHFDSKKEIFNLSMEPIIYTTLKNTITASKDLTKEEQLQYILTERIKLVSKNRKVIRLLLMESQINTELEGLNYIEKISDLFRNTISEIGIPIKDDKFIVRMLMGTILSFLYLPEDDEGIINNFVKNVMLFIIKN